MPLELNYRIRIRSSRAKVRRAPDPFDAVLPASDQKRDAQLVALRKENAELRASAELAKARLAHQEHVIRQLTEFCDAHPAYLEDKETPATTRQRRSTRIQRT